MNLGKVSGWHVAFLTFAVLLLAVPANNMIAAWLELDAGWRKIWGRLLPAVVLGAVVSIAYWRDRSWLQSMLGPLPDSRRSEVFWASVASVAIPFAVAGGFALWIWVMEGGASLEQRLSTTRFHDNSERSSFSPEGILLFLLLGPLLAPIVEEIIFRGVLFRAWAERWGWLAAMVLTSLLFAAYHRSFLTCLLSSVVFVCLYSRTGTLRAPMIAHGVSNLALFYPLTGQFVYPRPEEAIGDITTWWLQLASLVLIVIAVPAYVFLSSQSRIKEPVT